MRAFGIIGYPLGHSFSPDYFSEKFKTENIQDASYEAFPLEEVSHFPLLIAQQVTLRGLNVTIPYKKSIIPYLNSLDPLAAKLNSVNTIKVQNGEMIGYNTDVEGFVESIKPLIHNKIKKALVRGNGGSAQSVKEGLRQIGIEFNIVSRNANTGDLAYDNLSKALLSEYLLIINTTPLGMYPNIKGFPDLPYDAIGSEHLCFDLVYNPSETEFMKRSKASGAMVANGAKMLRIQAEAAWKIRNS